MEATNLITQTEDFIPNLSPSKNNISIIIAPDWSETEASLSSELSEVIKVVATHTHSNQIILLIDTGDIDEEEADLFVSGVVMNLLMMEDLDISTKCEISLLGNLDLLVKENFISSIHARIILKNESQAALKLLSVEMIPEYEIESFSNIELEKLVFDLSHRLFQQRKWQAAIVQYQILLNFYSVDAAIYWHLSQCYKNLTLIDKYFSTLRKGIELYPKDCRLNFSLIVDLQQNGHIQEAIDRADNAYQCLPDDYVFKILKFLILTTPTIYNYEDEIDFYRQNFTQGLKDLIEQTSLKTPQEKYSALIGIGCVTNFYISYQAKNDIELQREYGKLVHKIMSANFPKWVVPLNIPKIEPDHKIKIGYVSYYLHSYSGTLWLTGWLRYCNHESFEIYCYYIGNEPDQITQKFKDYSDIFHHIPHSLTDACEQIISDHLHILVFPEIGMDPKTIQIAALRLAPVQCVAWGHPVTTGLPTIDYFLSSELMEPENAEEHYSEELVRLPNIGVSYPKPNIPPVVKTRADFQLEDDAVIYLCCQAPFKYLPQYDFIFAEIAVRVPQAKFVFLRGTVLQPRLKRAFASVGLNSEDYCVFLSIPERLDYLMINLLSDVYLDTFTWSGGNTTLEAIACHLPIVTCPGEFMRGRHSYSFLKMLGVTDTIAENEAEYIEIAVKLGLDRTWRTGIIEQMIQNCDRLFDDQTCVASLEAFYKKVVNQKLI